jgi:hypothetical protein
MLLVSRIDIVHILLSFRWLLTVFGGRQPQNRYAAWQRNFKNDEDRQFVDGLTQRSTNSPSQTDIPAGRSVRRPGISHPDRPQRVGSRWFVRTVPAETTWSSSATYQCPPTFEIDNTENTTTCPFLLDTGTAGVGA